MCVSAVAASLIFLTKNQGFQACFANMQENFCLSKNQNDGGPRTDKGLLRLRKDSLVSLFALTDFLQKCHFLQFDLQSNAGRALSAKRDVELA